MTVDVTRLPDVELLDGFVRGRARQDVMGGVLAAEVARAEALAIGEDLGTVEPWLSAFLADRRVLGTSML